MTISFAKQVRNAVVSAEGLADTESAQRFRGVLDEFVVGLRELDVGARIQPGRDARKLTFYVHPPHRPGRLQLMLTFFLEGDKIVVVGETPTYLSSPDELQGWLLRYVQHPTFLESLGVLRDEGKSPVEARLCVDRSGSHSLNDMLVTVSPEEQARLDGVARDAEVELPVARIDIPTNAVFSPGLSYVRLESAGLVVSIDSVERRGEEHPGELLVKGTRA